MKIEPLSLKHEPLLQPRFKEMGLCLSEYSFASRYLFRREYHFKVVFENANIWLSGKTSDGQSYFMPTQPITMFSKEALLKLLEDAGCFYPMPEMWLSHFPSDKFQVQYNRNDSDYLFKRDKIANYPGRHLSRKRNLLKQFIDSYEPTIFMYNQQTHLEDAVFILNKWQKAFKGEHNDFLPCLDGLQLADVLGLSGSIYYIDSQPAAFILGEFLHSHLFDIHFAKAITDYKGIYPFLFQDMARQLASNEVSCLNWEQDLGEEGLRQSKLSYQPDKIASKFRIFAGSQFKS